MDKKLAFLPPLDVMACPNCGGEFEGSLDADKLQCKQCKTKYFHLNGVPCFFPGGKQQKHIWSHQMAVMQDQGRQGLLEIEHQLSRFDLSDSTRKRLNTIYSATQSGQQTILDMFTSAGVTPCMDHNIGQRNPGQLIEYYDQFLRDWAWGDLSSDYFEVNENHAALQKVLATLPDNSSPKNILVLGAGAGRLSWDLHQALKPSYTIALDSSPLLLMVANRLIRHQKPFQYTECKVSPQGGFPLDQTWDIKPPEADASLRESWFAIGANAWQPPFKIKSFDMIVTPWFIDVNGGDVRDTIGLISQLLAPNGYWVNSGPLLYAPQMPLQQKYSTDEIKEFIQMSHFELLRERLDNAEHLASPLEARGRHEQIWSFCAQYRPSVASTTPNWLIMPHLPIPLDMRQEHAEHPLVQTILSLVDGKLSINQISQMIAPNLPDDVEPREAVTALFGEQLES